MQEEDYQEDCEECTPPIDIRMAVKCRISVGLEEGDSEAADKTGCKAGIRGHPKKAFQEREARGLHGREKAATVCGREIIKELMTG